MKEAFEFFGGVAAEALFGNAATVVVEAAKERGKVERFNGYLKSSFVTPLMVICGFQ